MADISKITLPTGDTYDIKDETARTDISGKVSKTGDTMTANLTISPGGIVLNDTGTSSSNITPGLTLKNAQGVSINLKTNGYNGVVPGNYTPYVVFSTGSTTQNGVILKGVAIPLSNTDAANKQYVDNAFQANDAMLFKGTIGTGGTVTTLPDTHSQGWTYKVITAGTYAGKQCEIGDMIICVVDGTAANNDDWTVVQSNIDGAVTGPTSSVNGNIAVFDGTTGKVVKDGGITVSGLSTATNWTNGTGTGSVKLAGTASGAHSVAEGEETLASGTDSHAEGFESYATSQCAHAEGDGTSASGYASHAEGNGSVASGSNSHAEGYGTVANHKSQHTFGEYNTEDVNSNGATLRGTYVEMVGNGTSATNRSNARTLDWEGNEVLSGSIMVNNAVTLQFNTTTNALDFIFA